MDTIYDHIRNILNEQGGPNHAEFGDTRYDLARKILANLGGESSFGMTEYDIWREIADLLGVPVEFGDTLSEVVANIAHKEGYSLHDSLEWLDDIGLGGVDIPPDDPDNFTLIGGTPFTLISGTAFTLI